MQERRRCQHQLKAGSSRWTRRSYFSIALVIGLSGAGGILSPANAHILKIFAEVAGDTIIGQGYFSSGTFPMNVRVDVIGSNRQKVGEVVTNEQGKFTFKPIKRQNYTFVIDAGEGHHAEWTVEADELPATLSAVR